MKKSLKKLNQKIDSLALEAVMLDPGDIPGLGKVHKSFETLEELCKNLKVESLFSIIGGIKGYIEKVIMGEETDLAPVEAGISQLQEMCRYLLNGKDFNKDLSSLMTRLGSGETKPPPAASKPKKGAKKGKASLKETKEAVPKGKSIKKAQEKPGTIDEEDKEIINDFVAESLESLGTIEVKLMDLEQEPSNLETINAIFRPFHTVKGVSGFLNFNKINKLAHMSENLLDEARNGEISINEEIIDLILECVDLLKRMIESVGASLETGTPSEGDTDSGPAISKIEYLLAKIEQGEMPALGEMLVSKGAVPREDLQEALEIQKEAPEKKIGEILVEEKGVEAKEVVSALREQKKFGEPVSLQVKIDIDKLDGVVDMVGELAIAQSMLRQNKLISGSVDQGLVHIINQLNLITSGLQKTAMSLRMVPIKNTFQKMLRVVRDLAKKAGKEIRLVMSGEETEIDRNMVEEIYEPMVHMIRNSIDHGLESPEQRERTNKPRQGTIWLRAYYKGGNVVIEIEDDGRGLNGEKILKKAVSSGLVKEGEKLTDGEINNFIFHPGFSTAEKVTDISGRGVGMDVVMSKIKDRLRGSVDLESVEGKGMTVYIRLPLTLAIVDGMIVKVSGQRYIVPTLAVQESFKPKKSEYYTVKGEGEMVKVRDTLIPLIRLDRLFGLNGKGDSDDGEGTPWDKLTVVVENQERKICLLIDELLGQEEVVIKSLGGWLKNVRGIAGGSILGDGQVGLILDIAGIFSAAFEE